MSAKRAGSSDVPLADRLLPWLSGALAVLLVAALSAAVALPRYLEAPEPSSPPETLALPGTTPDEEASADLALSAEPPSAPPPAQEAARQEAGEHAPEATAPDPAPAVEEQPSADTSPPEPEQEPPPSPEPPPEYAAAPPAAPPAEDHAAQAEEGPASPAVSESERIFAEEFPAHAAARQTDDPSTRGWAVLVGVNRYQGRTQDTLGSVADVMVLRDVLLAHGWRDEHILVLTDGVATHDRIVRGIEWLMRTTDERSTVVFSFSGHMRHANGVSALWPTDNRFIWGPDLGRMLGAVPAGRMWASLQGCHAEGLRAPGLEGPGRVITYSSRVVEKSYEDPEVGHSVQGFFLFNEGLRRGYADADGDGRVSVQEAYAWAAPRARIRTSDRQSPLLADGAGEGFYLHLP